jgi:hypothetical protein
LKNILFFFLKKLAETNLVLHICTPKRREKEGSLAQLVQSICLTSRGSGVRIPQLPQELKRFQRELKAFFDFGAFALFYLLSFSKVGDQGIKRIKSKTCGVYRIFLGSSHKVVDRVGFF